MPAAFDLSTKALGVEAPRRTKTGAPGLDFETWEFTPQYIQLHSLVKSLAADRFQVPPAFSTSKMPPLPQ